MATKNPITGDELISRAPTDEYKTGWDRIFGQPKTIPVVCLACGQRKVECDKCVKCGMGELCLGCRPREACDAKYQCDSEGGCV